MEYKKEYQPENQVLSDLLNTRALLSSRARWTHGAYARGGSLEERRWCLVGAVGAVVIGKTRRLSDFVHDVLEGRLSSEDGQKLDRMDAVCAALWSQLPAYAKTFDVNRKKCLFAYNDFAGYTLVMELLDKAIDAESVKQPELEAA